MTKINDLDKDVLDGIDVPRLDRNVNPGEVFTSSSQSEQRQATDDPNDSRNPNRDELGESIVPPTDGETLFETIREAIRERAEYDNVNNDEYIVAGTLANSGMRLSDEETEMMINVLEGKAKRIQTKTKQLKDAVIIRQQAQPTVVTFDPNEDELLKKGMVKIFKHKENTITFEHYQAALEARRELADIQINKQLPDRGAIFSDRSTE